MSQAAEAALADHKFVSCLDVLEGMRWLVPTHTDFWRQGRAANLESQIQVGPEKLAEAMRMFRRWAEGQGLVPTETSYVARTRDRRPLQFTATGDPDLERAYRTHWVSPTLSEAKRQALAQKQSKAPDLVVISPHKDWVCTECGDDSGGLLLMEDPGPLCMECADLGHLVFLPSGDTALTRRARKASKLTAVVVRFSRARGRYERQGLLVEEAALDRAEEECRGDEEARRLRREREVQRRATVDVQFQKQFAQAIRELYPGCPQARAGAIAAHAAARGSGRVGRSAAGRALDPQAVTLAVAASVRHEDTPYDELLMRGLGRAGARSATRTAVEDLLVRWQQG